MLYFPGPFRRRKKFFRNCSSAFVCYYQDTGKKLPGSEFQCGEGQIWKLHLRYDALATIEIGTTVDVEDEFVVIGTKGRVTIPGDWWNTGYFEAKIDDSKGLKRYCFNFEGNGLRYLLQELLIMISDERTECTRLFNEESETLADILEIINQRG